jgi:virginiamycin B lyase
MGLKKGGEGSADPTVAPRVEMSDRNFESLVKYYSANIHPDLKQRGVVEAMFRPRGEGAKAVFTEWEVPREMGGINTAKPDSQGMIWFPAAGIRAVARLDPRTGEVKTWAAPTGDKAPVGEGIFHDLMVDQQDNVWVTGGGLNKIFKLDTRSFQFSVWDIPEDYGLKPHTGELDPEGNYWVTMQTGKPGKGWVVKLDPRTGKTTGYATQASFPHPYGPEPYGLVVDHKGIVWFTELFSGKLGKIDPKTGKMTEYAVPNPDAGPRRLDVDSKGNLWFTECFTGQIAKFDPATEKFTEYDLGVAGGGFPYSLRIDESDQVWFTMNSNNSVGKLDPATGQITYSFFPVPENNTIDPDFDPTAEAFTLVYGTHRAAVGRVYFRR